MDESAMQPEQALSILSRLRSRATQGADQRQQQVADLEAKVATLKAEIKRLRQAEGVLDIIIAAAESGYWCEVMRQLDRAKDLGRALDKFASGTSEQIESVRSRAASSAEESLSNLSSTLPKELERHGLSLEPSSRFPVFKLRNGFFEVKVNKSKYEAQITTRHGGTIKLAADTSLVVAAVRSEDARCFGTPPDLAEFIVRLRAAYAHRLGAEKPRPIPLDEVREVFVAPIPPRDVFVVALAAVLRDRPAEASGMNLDHTKSIDTGFLLPGFEDRGYFGHISFSPL